MKTNDKVRIGVALAFLLATAAIIGPTGLLERQSIEDGRKYVMGVEPMPGPDVPKEFAVAVRKADQYCDKVMVADAEEYASCVYFFSEVSKVLAGASR